MRLLFVSGPESPDTIAAGLRLMKFGYAVYYGQPVRMNLSPYASLLSLVAEDNQWRMRWNVSDMEMLKRCDAIYLCHNWSSESLCKVHMSFAKNSHKQIFFEGIAEPRG